jgi:hypothetical protein
MLKPSDGSNSLRALSRGRVGRCGTPKSADFKAAVNRMTNRQRHRWARARYPGLAAGELHKVQDYAPAERVVDWRAAPIARRA